MATVLATSQICVAAQQLVQTGATLRIAPDAEPQTLIDQARDVDVIIVRDPLPIGVFASAPRLRAVIRHGTGLDMIPVDAANAAGVLVANVPGVNARSVAEHVFLLTLALARHLTDLDRTLREQGWAQARSRARDTVELSGGTLGLVGTGQVARAVAAIASAGFGMRVLGTNAHPERTPEGIEYRTLDDVLAESDVVVLACPLTEQTRGLIDARRLRTMKSSALLVNVARGAVIDEEALAAALGAGVIAGAALDVFSTQPLPTDHPLLGLSNAILTPHVAGITEQSMQRMGLGAAKAALEVLAGRVPAHTINPEVVRGRQATGATPGR